jgi:hypothetical protein
MATDMNDNIAKWSCSIDPVKQKDLLDEYVTTKIYEYKSDRSNDRDLWELFQHDFQNFTIETFNSLPLKTLQSLRQCLQCGGVWVAQNEKNVTYASSFFEVLHEEEPYEWTENDIKQSWKDFLNAPVTSVFVGLDGFKDKPTNGTTPTDTFSTLPPTSSL